MLRSTLAALISLSLVACISPATRPAKIKPGFSATVAGAMLYGAKNERRCDRTCVGDDAEAINFLLFDARIGHMLSEDSGIAFGAYLASGSTTKIEDADYAANAYVQTSLQTDRYALSLALEGGVNAIGPTATAQFFPNPRQQHLSFAAYGRVLRPFKRDENGSDTSVEVATWDAGVAFRLARVLMQYSYYSRDSGFEDFDFDSGGTQARDWHIITIGHEF